MDLSKMLPPKPPGGDLRDSTLRKLTKDAGQREESWERMREAVRGEHYLCTRGELHDSIVNEFNKIYGQAAYEWAKSQNLSIVKIHVKDPALLKKGLTTPVITPPSGAFGVVIPFYSQHGEISYLPNKDDFTTQTTIDWQNPLLLPNNSAIVLLNGEIKFQMVLFDCEVVGVREE
ncbi:hypothetical protein VTG60DRAFT_7358 [Thermothelomyces hinnuleus]